MKSNAKEFAVLSEALAVAHAAVERLINQTPPEHKLMKQLFEDWKKTLVKADSLIITEKL
jgi:hypothetical protein